MTTLKTDRLRLRPFREDDFEAYARLVGDADVVRFLAGGAPRTRAEAWREMAMIVGHWQLRGFGPWAVEERGRLGLIGRIGFFEPEGWPGFELGWVLAREAWGRGYATEGAAAALRYAFTDLKRERVISLIAPDNVPSIRVAERIGERLEGRTDLFGTDVLVYAIDRLRWQA